MSKKLLMIAGEASGDLHGSALIHELKSIDNQVQIWGIGGDKMAKTGMNILYHINKMSFLGFIEVLKHLPFIRKVKRDLISFVKNEGIKNVVFIDYPGFNLSLAKSLNKIGTNNIYYISPQIWAWGLGRIKKIKKIISRMIVFFPFEKKLYAKNKIDVDFIGHPLVKKLEEYNYLTQDQLNSQYNLDPNKEILLLLPGSRKQEIDKILPVLLDASEKLSKDFNLQIVVACSDNIAENYFDSFKTNYRYKVIKHNTYDLIKNSKFVITKSGTSTLETGIIGTPFIVVYKTNYLTYIIGKALVKIKNIALANIVAEKNIVTELIQSDVNPNRVYRECKNILENSTKYLELKEELKIIRNKLKTEGNPSRKAAEIIIAEINAN